MIDMPTIRGNNKRRTCKKRGVRHVGLYRETWAEIDLDAIEHNIKQMKKQLPRESKMFAVVKANGYGHGAVNVATVALQAGTEFLAVALLEEAIELREAGITAPILVFGYVHPKHAHIAAEHNITLTVFQTKWIQEVDENTLSQDLRVHFKWDTGMGRIGIHSKNDIKMFINELNRKNSIKLTGVYTHFATADDLKLTNFNAQKEMFNQWLAYFKTLWTADILIHWANSAATIRQPDDVFDAVRFGISMYGLYPSPSIRKLNSIQLKQAFSLHSRLIHVKKVKHGASISYGATYHTEQDEWIGTIPLGYADGWNRKLQGFHVLINGKRQKIVGRICMDQLMVKLDEPYDPGTKVTLIGKQDEEEITVDDVADYLETINYEIPCMITNRVPRIIKEHHLKTSDQTMEDQPAT